PPSSAAPTAPRTAAHATVPHPQTLGATATGSLAPGFSTQLTSTITSGKGRGLSGLGCPQPATAFTFNGASLASSHPDTLTVVNPGAEDATVDVDLADNNGPVSADAGKGMIIKAGTAQRIPLRSLTKSTSGTVSVSVLSRSGRVAAALQSVDSDNGSDWIPTAISASGLVVPGISSDVKDTVLTVYNPGIEDTTLNVRVSTGNGVITPAGHDTVDVAGGSVTTVDLGDITHGQPAAILLSPAPGSPSIDVSAGAEVTRGSTSSGTADTAFLAAAPEVGARGEAAGSGSSAGGSSLTTTVLLTAPGKKPAKAAVNGRSVSIPAGATVATKVDGGSAGPDGAVTVTTPSGAPAVYAARMLSANLGGTSAFTVQPLADDHGEVLRPAARDNDSVLFDDAGN
ncbi:hypothetical protein BIV57_13610, partial [Mangrovactinospora gilvigrisea]